VDFNRRCADFWGLAGEAKPQGKFSGALRTFRPDGVSLPETDEPVAIALRTGEPIDRYELIIERPNGSRVLVEVSAEPIFDERHTLVGVVGCIQDVTKQKEIEAGLKGERQTLAAIIEAAPECIKTVASDGTLLRMNAAGLRMIEAENGAAIEGRSVFDFIAPEFQEVWKTNHERVCSGEKLSWEFDIIAPSGTRRHMESQAVPIALPDGKTAQLAITRDVTQEKISNTKMIEKEHRFRQVLEALPIALYTTDAEGKITFFNRQAVELAGRIPKLGSDEWCVTWRLYDLDGALIPHDRCPMAISLKEQRQLVGAETIAERPDGSRVHFVPYPSPIFDRSGRMVGAVNMLLDVSKRREDEIQAARFAAIVACSDDAIVSKTLEGIITTWNAGAERIFGFTAGEMIGQHITRIVPPELCPEEEDILARLRRGEHIDHFETVRVAKNGRRIDVSVTVSPIRDKSGKIVGASKVGRDITERKQFERLQQLLIRELNHRVKNTLATVQSIANQTVHRAKSPDEFASSFGGRLQALARTHALLTQSSWQGAELAAIVRDQLPLIDTEDERISFSGPVVMLNAQAALHLGLVLHELATNAIKYGALSARRGRLSIKWMVRSEGGRHLVLQWQERGGPKISVPQSRGFGTSLIEKSLEAHGGITSIHYEAEGVTCEIMLPLPQSDPAVGGSYNKLLGTGLEISKATRSYVKNAPTVSGKHVLVVDDEPLIAMDIVASLEDEGCHVVGPAATLQKALALIENSKIDVALLDANLAGEPVDALAAALVRRKIPFAFVSGYGREGLPEAFRQAELIKKPFQRQRLIDVVQQMLLDTNTVVPLRRSP
jgi:PAS domain S-box-containing protein